MNYKNPSPFSPFERLEADRLAAMKPKPTIKTLGKEHHRSTPVWKTARSFRSGHGLLS